MAYCTVEDVRNALAPSSDWSSPNQTAATLEDSQIEDAIAEAEGEIDLYIGRRYKVVEAIVDGESIAPKPIRMWTRTVAAYLAALTFRKNKDLSEDDPIRLRYERVMRMLEAVRDRKADLPITPVDTDDQGVYVENLNDFSFFELEDVGLGVYGHYSQHIEPSRRWS